MNNILKWEKDPDEDHFSKMLECLFAGPFVQWVVLALETDQNA